MTKRPPERVALMVKWFDEAIEEAESNHESSKMIEWLQSGRAIAKALEKTETEDE